MRFFFGRFTGLHTIFGDGEIPPLFPSLRVIVDRREGFRGVWWCLVLILPPIGDTRVRAPSAHMASSSCARQLSRLARGLARLRAEAASSGALPSGALPSGASSGGLPSGGLTSCGLPSGGLASASRASRVSSSFPFASSPLAASSLPSPPLARGFRATAGAAMGARDAKSMKIVAEGKKLRPRPRGIEPPETPWAAGARIDPNFGRGGGGMSPFTPTAQLRKRKTYQKRCAYIMQTLEHEKMSEIAAGSAVPAFRPGDVLRVKVEVLENRRRANWFTGVCIARRNRGMGSSFTLRSVMANVPVERTFPLYSPTVKEVEIVERRKVRRAKLYYLREKPLRYSRV